MRVQTGLISIFGRVATLSQVFMNTLERRAPTLLLFAIGVLFLLVAVYRHVTTGKDSNAPIITHTGTGTVHAQCGRQLSRVENDYLELFIGVVMNLHYNYFPGYVDGNDVPPQANALSMAGKRRLDNFALTVADAIANRVPGDIIETGSWRGGASFVAARVIDIMEPGKRIVFLCDSFKGIPAPPSDRVYNEEDHNANFPVFSEAVSTQKLRVDAEHFGLKKDAFRVVEGYFNETLPALLHSQPSIQFSVLRLDGDTYFSTMDALRYLYPRLSPGGFVIIDDFIDWAGCRQAVDDYRAKQGVQDPIVLVPHRQGEILRGAYWRKGSGGAKPVTGRKGDGSVLRGEDRVTTSLPLCLGGPVVVSSANGQPQATVFPSGSYRPQRQVAVPTVGPAGLVYDPKVFQSRSDLMMCVD
jgi:hypothetical protein